MTLHAIRLRADDTAVTVASFSKTVTDECRRSFHPWWTVINLSPESTCTGPMVIADVDPGAYDDLAARVTGGPHDTVTCAGVPASVAHRPADQVVLAVAPQTGLAYRCELDTGSVSVYGHEAGATADAAVRLAREAMRRALLRGGWSLLRASAVVREGKAVLIPGPRGVGKTTAALAMAAHHGWSLLADDGAFVRAHPATGVRVLPLPSPVAVGLGALDALGWYGTVSRRLDVGEDLPCPWDRRVTEAILAGHRGPHADGNGRELKAAFLPGQLAQWFGLSLASGSRAAGLLFPRMSSDAVPALSGTEGALSEGGLADAEPDEGFSALFGPADDPSSEGRAQIVRSLSRLPCHGVLLGRNVDATADLLAKITEDM
jgi:hypothetical protein